MRCWGGGEILPPSLLTIEIYLKHFKCFRLSMTNMACIKQNLQKPHLFPRYCPACIFPVEGILMNAMQFLLFLWHNLVPFTKVHCCNWEMGVYMCARTYTHHICVYIYIWQRYIVKECRLFIAVQSNSCSFGFFSIDTVNSAHFFKTKSNNCMHISASMQAKRLYIYSQLYNCIGVQ